MKKQSPDNLICVKCGFFAVVVFFWASGIALICLGASVQVKLSDISVVIAETSSGAPLALMIVGMAIFVLSGFGALAAIKESSVMIKIFTGIMLLVFIIEIIVGISAYSYKDMLQNIVLKRFMKMLNRYAKDRTISRGVDGVQQQAAENKMSALLAHAGISSARSASVSFVKGRTFPIQCCGGKNFTDWFKVKNISGVSSGSVPTSCCKVVKPRCGKDAGLHSDLIYAQGCVTKMKMWVSDHVDVIGALGIGLGFSQILGILLACILLKILQENSVSL